MVLCILIDLEVYPYILWTCDRTNDAVGLYGRYKHH